MSDDSSKPVKRASKVWGSLVPWHPVGAIVFLVVLYFLADVLAQIGITAYVSFRGWNNDQAQAWLEGSVFPQFFYVLMIDSILVVAIGLFLKRYKGGIAAIGLKRPRLGDLGYALGAYPFYFVGLIIVTLIASSVFTGLNIDQEQELGFDNPTGGLQLAVTFVSLVILPPLIEEVLFRGVLFASLRKRLQFWISAVITSFIFACAHLSASSEGPLYIAAIDTFILSLVLCWLREKTGSLWASILLHAIKNGVAFATLFIIASI